MSLTSALNTARSSLLSTSGQIAVSSRNVAGAGDPTYSRKVAQLITNGDGSVHLGTIRRSSDLALYFTMLGATSRASGQEALATGIGRLATTIGDPEDEQSPAARLSALTTALQQASSRPDDPALAQSVLSKASDLATTLNAAANTVHSVRQQADQDIASSVSSINDLLAKFKTLNDTVVQGSFAGADVSDALDKRDAVLSQISEQIGVSVVTRPNNDMVIYADSGVTLFETTPRTVTFDPTSAYAGGTTGNAVFIDGVPVTGANATMPIHNGALAGLTQLRDVTTTTYESQLDELARGLVEAFAESDQSGGGGPDRAGLFTWSGGPGVPASGTHVAGLAGSLSINAAVDPSKGGQISRLRDGGINGAAYVYNTTGGTAFSDRLNALTDGLTAARSFDPSTGLEASQGLAGFGTASSGWLEGLRQSVSTDVSFQNTLLSRASDALSNATGVNLDDEYALQLQLEQSYAASSKLIGVVSDLFDALMSSV